MKTITLTNQKGGVSKSTTAYALATGLVNRGHKVLIVDADPQSNLSFTAGVDLLNMDHSLYDVFHGETAAIDALHNIRDGLDILTAGLEAAAVDMEFAGRAGREFMLREVLDELKADYDYCVIDTPPTLGILTMNAITAADCLVIPLNMDIYSLQGMEQLHGFINNVRKYTNPTLKISGLLLTKYHDRQNVTQVLIDAVNKAAASMETTVYKTHIRESVAVKETQIAQTDLFSEAPQATATKDYNAFIDEFLAREGKNTGK